MVLLSLFSQIEKNIILCSPLSCIRNKTHFETTVNNLAQKYIDFQISSQCVTCYHGLFLIFHAMNN